jgi:hypothetical protein
MGILKDNQMIFIADSKYDSVFETLTKKDTDLRVEIKHIYILAATIGFKNSKRIKVESRGKETRTNYLSYKEESLLLNMVLADNEINNIDEIVDDNNKIKVKNIIDEYANGGMSLIVEKGLFTRWDGENLENHDEHIIYDLSKYIISEIREIPF